MEILRANVLLSRIPVNKWENIPICPKRVVHGLPEPNDSFSCLGKYKLQNQILRERILPLLTDKNKEKKKLTILVIGPYTCEEVATLCASVINEFEEPNNSLRWGNIKDWNIKFYGIDMSEEHSREGLLKITGRKRFNYPIRENCESQKQWIFNL